MPIGKALKRLARGRKALKAQVSSIQRGKAGQAIKSAAYQGASPVETAKAGVAHLKSKPRSLKAARQYAFARNVGIAGAIGGGYVATRPKKKKNR